MQTLLPQLLTVETFNPTSSIVGNGIPGQVSAAFLNSYSWRIVSKDLPGFVKTGEFPNSQNPNSIIAQVINFLWPYRGGLNLSAQNFMQRPPRGPIGISAVGIVFVGPETNIKIAGTRGTVWNLNAVVANVFGEDEYGGNPGAVGDYHYQTGEFITCLLYTSPSPRDGLLSRMPSSA